ncbi:hypothetical protein ASPCAL05105 [Aspergillus calidoustus]|uniref:Uncharacterized protein n=1 Tax=Aspergillus calidoustus TaxID=454130 RepID=A0A0U5FWG7_ASPCI|nr:hypothetical protein ASPCAL05105 [Aspergillus calidoustus]
MGESHLENVQPPQSLETGDGKPADGHSPPRCHFFKRLPGKLWPRQDSEQRGREPAQGSSSPRRNFWERNAAECVGLIVSLVRCYFFYQWPWKSISLGEMGMKVGPDGTSEQLQKALKTRPRDFRVTTCDSPALRERNQEKDGTYPKMGMDKRHKARNPNHHSLPKMQIDKRYKAMNPNHHSLPKMGTDKHHKAMFCSHDRLSKEHRDLLVCKHKTLISHEHSNLNISG